MGFVMYGAWEDALNRHETVFYQKVGPLLADTAFKFPKVFFAGTYSSCVMIYVSEPLIVNDFISFKQQWMTRVIETLPDMWL